MKEVEERKREQIPFRYFSGISMTECSAAPARFPEHWHMSAEFILAQEDGCRFLVKGEEYVLKEGDMLLIWPTQLHETLASPPDGHMILQFSSELLSSCNDFNIYYYSLRNLHHLDESRARARDYLSGKMRESMELYRKEEPFSETKIRMKIYEILLFLCETQLENGSFPESESRKHHDTYVRIQNACNYIKKNSREDLTQKMVADFAGFSPYYFSRVFKEYTQESFTEYLTRQRIHNALTLLYQENITITDVAYLSGFQSISNFSKVFRSVMQCSPMEYRKKHRPPSRVSDEHELRI